ncbi:MAG TPA: extracellular solute-binding protein [Burkholderiales bacterium]|nr:extracellular solute-binding protein [Burkholderiales bacterium]
MTKSKSGKARKDSASGTSRRKFLKSAGAGAGIAALSSTAAAPFIFARSAQAADKELKIVQWSHFVPAFDTWFDQFAKDWGAKNGVAVTVDHVPVQDIPARAAAEASAGAGHDLFGFNGSGGAHLYRRFFMDVGELVRETEKKYGKVTVIGKQLGYNADDGSWSAWPDYYINFPGMYQKSLWDEIGMLPDTWDNLRIGGAKLKAKGHPVGLPLGHSNDPNANWRGVLWSYGASIQDAHGSRIVLHSKEAIEAVKYGAALFKEAMTSDVLSWNDSSNNQYIDSGVGSYIINPISAYRTAQTLNKKLADDIYVIEPPKGPVRRMMGAASEFYGIWKFAKNKEAAKEFLRHYAANWREAFVASSGYNNPCFAGLVPKPMPILSDDPTSTPHDKLAILQDSGEWSAIPGYPGPASPAMDEIYYAFIVPDMMAKAATGQLTPEESVKWAAGQCEAIFKKWHRKT